MGDDGVLAGDPSSAEGVSRAGGQGSKIYALSLEPKEHECICPGTQPGRQVTKVTGQSFMCSSFVSMSCPQSCLHAPHDKSSGGPMMASP